MNPLPNTEPNRDARYLAIIAAVALAASLYPEWLAVIYRLGGNDFAVVLLQCLLHVGTCLLVFSLGRRLYNSRTGLLAGLFCAMHPMLLRYVPDLHMEAFLTFLCTLTIWATVRFHQQQ